jgi:hypothetical protein
MFGERSALVKTMSLAGANALERPSALGSPKDARAKRLFKASDPILQGDHA